MMLDDILTGIYFIIKSFYKSINNHKCLKKKNNKICGHIKKVCLEIVFTYNSTAHLVAVYRVKFLTHTCSYEHQRSLITS